jgi:hypothetical protein
MRSLHNKQNNEVIMKTYKSLIAGAAVVAALMTSGYAGQVDWSVSYNGTVDQSQVGGSYTSCTLWQNVYGWDRSVSAWQSFQAGSSGWLGGVAVEMIYAQANGSVDLNVYSGTGVQGTLLESTHLQWSDSFPWQSGGPYYGFHLASPVTLTAGSEYTFSFENLGADGQLSYVVNTSANAYPAGEYMQQGYFGGDGYGMDYTAGTTAQDMNFQTVMATTVPEPSTAANVLLGLGFLTMAWYRKAAVARG